MADQPFVLQGFKEVVHRTDDLVEDLVHQFGFLLFRNIDHRLQAAAGKPAGLRVCGPAAGEDQYAGVCPEHRIQVSLESFFRHRMVQVADIYPDTPFLPVFPYVRPEEAPGIVLWIPEILHFVARFAQPGNHFLLVGVPPA